MKSFKFKTFEKGKCQRCGVEIPDRFWNPHYCWSCKRKRQFNAQIVVATIVMLIVVLSVTMSLTATLISVVIASLIVWITIKHNSKQ